MAEKKDYRQLAAEILKNVGGKENVKYLEHCSTRLRFNLADASKADATALKAIPGVLSVIHNAQFQVVIGNDVLEVYHELISLGSFGTAAQGAEHPDAAPEKPKIGAAVLDFVIGVFNPLIPAITAGGLIKTILTLLTTFGLLDKGSGVYSILFNAADAAFYFLPVMVAYTAAAKLNVDRILAAVIMGLTLLPNMTAALGKGITFLGVSVPNYSYGTQIFPAILTVLFMAPIEKSFTKICPKPVRIIFVPVVTTLAVAPVSMLILSPLGFKMGELFTNALLSLHSSFGWIVVSILGAILPFLTAAGMHKPLVPYATAAFGSMGYEKINAPAKVAHNISEAGACFAVAVRSKNPDTRSAALSAGISAFFGISEPALYGVTLQNKNAMIGVVASGFLAATFMGVAGLRSMSLMNTGILGLPQFIDPANGGNLIIAIVGYALSISLSFGITFFLYKEEKK